MLRRVLGAILDFPRLDDETSKDLTSEMSTHSDDDFEEEATGIDANQWKEGKICLGITIQYVQDWSPCKAFGDFYQNWKDGLMMSSPELKQRDIKPVIVRTAEKTEIMVHSQKGDLLGFIRFDKKGDLELTNFQSKIEPIHLRMGESSKRARMDVAGIHGEGLKLAALVMERDGHRVKLVSDSYGSNFYIEGSTLYCYNRPVAGKYLEQDRKKAENERAEERGRYLTEGYAFSDVKVRVGKLNCSTRQPIAEFEFNNWLSIVLELREKPPTMVLTAGSWGDLILDPSYRSWLSLKGVQINGYGPEYRFGYNMLRGRVGRDRRNLVSEEEESQILTGIWEEAVENHGAQAIDAYLSLFDADQKVYSELRLTQQRLRTETANKLWQRLRQISENSFFYLDSDDTKCVLADEALIRDELGHEPYPLCRSLWDFLKQKHIAIRTPQEEQSTRFLQSMEVASPADTFGRHVCAVVRAALQLQPRMGSVEICIVDGGQTRLDLAFDKQRSCLKIHRKWIDFDLSHEGVTCDLVRMRKASAVDEESFHCDHVLRDLLKLITDPLRSQLNLPPHDVDVWYREALARAEMIPRHVMVTQTTQVGELQVFWVGNETGCIQRYAESISYVVVLHKHSSCSLQRDTVMHLHDSLEKLSELDVLSTDVKPTTEKTCGCPRQTVSRRQSTAVFTKLDVNEQYFAVVARRVSFAFLGLSPTLSSPRSVPILNEDNDDLMSIDMDLVTVDSCEQDAAIETGQDTRVESNTTSAHDPSFAAERHHKINLRTDLDERHAWYKDELPRAFALLAPHRDSAVPERRGSKLQLLLRNDVADGHCEVDNSITVGHYYRVHLRTDSFRDCVVLVREIWFSSTEPTLDTTHLVVTMYSVKKAWFAGSGELLKPDLTFYNPTELLLHFSRFDRMGERDDAEVIRLSQIERFASLTVGHDHRANPVTYAANVPATSTRHPQVYCRYAIQNMTAKSNRDICIVPLPSSMLDAGTKQQQTSDLVLDKDPVIVDCTPHVLGAAEGFSRAGLRVAVGCGFDPSRHASWKIRYPDADIYRDFSTFEAAWGSPNHQAQAGKDVSRIALVAGRESVFKDNDQCVDTIDPVELMLNIVRSEMTFVTYVLILSPAVLRGSHRHKLDMLLDECLEQRLTVRIRLESVAALGVPQNREVLCMVFRPERFTLIDQSTQHATSDSATQIVPHLLCGFSGDGALQLTGSLCDQVTVSERLPGDASWTNIEPNYYNHEPGRHARPGHAQPVSMEAARIGLGPGAHGWLEHSARGDGLTVREIACAQGFAHDFVFYQSLPRQLKDVVTATPPPLTQKIGHSIVEAWKRLRDVAIIVDPNAPMPATLGTNFYSSRKRARADIMEDDTELHD